jgi:hypothetical protein
MIMVNHLRTLLLNENGSNRPGYSYPLEEYVASDFVVSKMPFECQKIWNILFGMSPDRAYRNWRLYQIAQFAEASDLKKYWYKFDNRITYLDRQAYDESKVFGKVNVTKASTGAVIDFVDSANGIVVDPVQLQTDSESVGMFLSGKLISDESKGRCKNTWKIDLTSSTSLQVTNLTTNVSDYYTLSFSNNLSSSVPLPGTGLTVQFRPVTSETWSLDTTAKPSTDVGTVLANLKSIGDLEIGYIFSGDYPEYATFSEYWHKNENLAERISAVALGLAYKLEEKRAKK